MEFIGRNGKNRSPATLPFAKPLQGAAPDSARRTWPVAVPMASALACALKAAAVILAGSGATSVARSSRHRWIPLFRGYHKGVRFGHEPDCQHSASRHSNGYRTSPFHPRAAPGKAAVGRSGQGQNGAFVVVEMRPERRSQVAVTIGHEDILGNQHQRSHSRRQAQPSLVAPHADKTVAGTGPAHRAGERRSLQPMRHEPEPGSSGGAPRGSAASHNQIQGRRQTGRQAGPIEKTTGPNCRRGVPCRVTKTEVARQRLMQRYSE